MTLTRPEPCLEGITPFPSSCADRVIITDGHESRIDRGSRGSGTKRALVTRTPRYKHAVVIGGGLSGLAASRDLLQAGYCVTGLEAAPDFGGLASSFRLEGTTPSLSVRQASPAVCHRNGLGSPAPLAPHSHRVLPRSPLLSLRHAPQLAEILPGPVGAACPLRPAYLTLTKRSQWRWLDKIPAKAWLIENISEEVYQAIWHPLLKVKFGDDHNGISGAWIWHRIWRVAQSRRRLLERRLSVSWSTEPPAWSTRSWLTCGPIPPPRCAPGSTSGR
jgi:hypothetical protein